MHLRSFSLTSRHCQSNATVVTLFREPIARSMSHYNHYSKRMNEKHAQLMEGIDSPEDFTNSSEQQSPDGIYERLLEPKGVLEDKDVLEKHWPILTDWTPLASPSTMQHLSPTLASSLAGRTPLWSITTAAVRKRKLPQRQFGKA